MIRIRWTERAAEELEDAVDYIAKDNPAAARKIPQNVRDAIRKLRDAPLIGRPGKVAGTRELDITAAPLLVVYESGPHAITIVSVWHTSRNRPHH